MPGYVWECCLNKGRWGSVGFRQVQGRLREVLECNRGQTRERGNLEFVFFFFFMMFLFFLSSLLWMAQSGPEVLNLPMTLMDRGSPSYPHPYHTRSYSRSPYLVLMVCGLNIIISCLQMRKLRLKNNLCQVPNLGKWHRPAPCSSPPHLLVPAPQRGEGGKGQGPWQGLGLLL